MDEAAARPLIPGRLRPVVRLLGLAAVVFLVVAITFMCTMPGVPRERARLIASMSNMRQILFAASAYASDHESQWPGHVSRLEAGYLPPDPGALYWPLRNPREGYWSYRLVLPDRPVDELDNPSDVAVLYEVRDDGTIDPDGCIGYADGRVERPQGRSKSP